MQAEDTETRRTLDNVSYVTDLLVMNWFCRFTRIMSIFFIAFTEMKNSREAHISPIITLHIITVLQLACILLLFNGHMMRLMAFLVM